MVVRSGCVNTAARSIVQQIDRGRAVADEPPKASSQADAEHVHALTPFHIAEELTESRRRMIPPAVFGQGVRGQEVADVLSGAAARELDRLPTERSPHQPTGVAGVRKARLGLERQGAAKRVQPKQRIRAWNDIGTGDRVHRNQIPVDGVTEWLVGAHAVEIDRHALRQAEQRRDREAAKLHIGLERIVLGFVEVNARHRRREHVAKRCSRPPLEIGRADDLDVRRHDRGRNAKAMHRRDGHNLNFLTDNRNLRGRCRRCRWLSRLRLNQYGQDNPGHANVPCDANVVGRWRHPRGFRLSRCAA